MHAKSALALYLAHNSRVANFLAAEAAFDRTARNIAAFLAIAASMASAVACRPSRDAPAAADAARRHAAATCVVSLRSDPQSFNWYTRHDASTYLVTLLTQAWLVRVNRVTDTRRAVARRELDGARPTACATRSSCGQGVTFADGAPFTADDVVFSLAAAYDEKGGSILADSMRVGGKNLTAEAVDPATVVDRLSRAVRPRPAPVRQPADPAEAQAPGDCRRRTGLASAWRTSSNPADITGLGPFTLAEYAAGPAAGVRAQPALLPQGRGRHPAAATRSRRHRDRPGPERRAAAPGGRANRPLGGRDPARGLCAASSAPPTRGG